MPARDSTAALLLLLLVGDVVAVFDYRRDCDWSLLRHLIPGVLPGVVLGASCSVSWTTSPSAGASGSCCWHWSCCSWC